MKKELHDRINKIINTEAFEKELERQGIDLFEFQCSWVEKSQGDFNNLPESYQGAILAGETELKTSGELKVA